MSTTQDLIYLSHILPAPLHIFISHDRGRTHVTRQIAFSMASDTMHPSSTRFHMPLMMQQLLLCGDRGQRGCMDSLVLNRGETPKHSYRNHHKRREQKHNTHQTLLKAVGEKITRTHAHHRLPNNLESAQEGRQFMRDDASKGGETLRPQLSVCPWGIRPSLHLAKQIWWLQQFYQRDELH